MSADPTAVVLVEGASDQVALQTLALRLGRDLDREGVAVVPMGGAMGIVRFLEQFGPRGMGLRVAGLCDEPEEGFFRRGLERAGFGSNLTRPQMEGLGFYTSVADLEDELIRALGAPAVEEILASEGDLTAFRILQRQPAQQHRTTHQQLRHFMGTRSGRKGHYAAVLVDALELAEVPRPLTGVLSYV